ncbi:MAG: ankyrin repeat domain-containing protein [Bdellovibrio sp.]|nr:ankyrin repeat domain-containing protein [Bdellovibrio sp.]
MRSYNEFLKTKQDEAPLLQAARAGDMGRIAREILAGANLEEKNHRGYTALMLAVYNGNYDAALLLIEAGADVNSSDKGGNTILMGAAFKGHRDLVFLLLKSGAHPNDRNYANQTALDFAKTFGRSEVIPLIENHARPLNFFERATHFVSFFYNQISYRFKSI